MTLPTPGPIVKWTTISGLVYHPGPVVVTSADSEDPSSKSLGRFTQGQVTQMGAWLTGYYDLDSSGKVNPGPNNVKNVLGDTPTNFLSRGDYGSIISPYVRLYVDFAGGHGTTANAGDPGGATPELAGNPLSAFTSVLDFLNTLWGVISNHIFWERVLEVALGAALIGIGAAHLGAPNPISRLAGVHK